MNWLKRRMRERSTLNGGVILTTLLGVWLGPVQADVVVSALAALYGVYETIRAEQDGI